MAVNKKIERLSIRLTLDLKDKLQILADAENRKLSDFVFWELKKLVDQHDKNKTEK
jgi:predicted transcriptional regulator